MVPIKNNCSLQNDFGNGWGLYVDIENLKTLPKSYEISRKKFTITINKNYSEIENELDFVDDNNEISNNFIVNIIIIVIITYTILTIS